MLSDRTRSNEHKLKRGRYPLNIRKDFFAVQVTEDWHVLSGEVVESLSLDILGSHPHVALGSCICLALLEQDNWTKWFLSPPEPSFRLQPFCERWFGNVLGTWLEPALFFAVIASCGEETDTPFPLGILGISDRIMRSCNPIDVAGVLKSTQRIFLVFSSSTDCHKRKILCHANFTSHKFLTPLFFSLKYLWMPKSALWM